MHDGEGVAAVEQRVRRLATRLTGRDPSGGNLRADYGLDSLDLIHFVSEVEVEFSIVIPEEELSEDNFVSVETTAQLVARLGVR